MYLLIPILALSILSTETALSLESEAKILDYKNNNDGPGNYFFSFRTSNGIVRQETGRLVNGGTPDEYITVEGFYSYSDEEGNTQTINYTADRNGFLIKQPIPNIPSLALPGTVIASLLG